VILKAYHEIVGMLVNILIGDDNKIVLVFSLEKTVEVSKNAIDQKILYEMKGERIGLMNLNGQFKIRKIQKRIRDGKRRKNK